MTKKKAETKKDKADKAEKKTSLESVDKTADSKNDKVEKADKTTNLGSADKKEKCSGGPIIKLDDVWKIYQMGDVEVPALRGMSLEILPCEFVSLIGPSGSGKSTAMNMVGCLDVPTRGRIFLDGKDIASMDESDLAQVRGKKIGFIFQQFNLISNLTALENVMLPMMFQSTSSAEREDRARKLLSEVGLKDRMHHKPSELSGGQQQRVAIARALVNDPKVILADEPTGNLDSKTGEEVLELLKRLHKNENKTIIMVTHDLGLAKKAERVIRIKDGKVINGE